MLCTNAVHCKIVLNRINANIGIAAVTAVWNSISFTLAVLHPACSELELPLLNDTYFFYCFFILFSYRELRMLRSAGFTARKRDSAKRFGKEIQKEIRKRDWGSEGRLLFNLLKEPRLGLRDKTERTDPVVRDVFILCSGRNAVLRVTDFLIVNPAAVDTIPFCHKFMFLKDRILICRSRHKFRQPFYCSSTLRRSSARKDETSS